MTKLNMQILHKFYTYSKVVKFIESICELLKKNSIRYSEDFHDTYGNDEVITKGAPSWFMKQLKGRPQTPRFACKGKGVC